MKKARIFTTLALTAAMVSNMMFPSIILAETVTDETDETQIVTGESTETEVTETLATETEVGGTEVTGTEVTETLATETDVEETDETIVETDETDETSETSETEETESELVAFDQTVIVDDTRIQVTADEGVFPEGSYLEATRIESIDINRSSNINLVDAMSFDICIYNEDGVEIEPDTEAGSVHVLFFDERISDTNLDTTVYHIEDNTSTSLTYNYVDGNGDITDSEDIAVAVEAATDGFSVYTVEFTYNDMFYVLDGDTSVSLSTILGAVDLTGDVENVSISNTSLIGYDGTNVTALQPFNSTESMLITINGVDYEIIITDANDIATCGDDAYAIIYDNGTMVIQKGNSTDSTIGATTHILALGTSDTPWYDENNSIDYREEITNIVISCELRGRTSLTGMFYGCSNLTSVTGLGNIDTTNIDSASAMFAACSSLASVDAANLDVSNLSDVSSMFASTALTSMDLSSWDVSNISNFSSLFASCSQLASLTLDNWNIDSATSANSFGGFIVMTNLSTLSMKNWSNIPTNFSNGFGRTFAEGATTIDVTGWDLTGVTSLNGLFCSSEIENIVGINTWTNTSSLTDISNLFNGTQITTVDVSGLNTTNVTNFSSMFFNCTKLESIDLSTFVFNCDISGTGGMFYGTTPVLQTVILPESFSNAVSGNSNSLSLTGYWVKEGETEEILGSNIVSGGTYTAVEITDRAVAGYNAEAILYSDGTLVFCIKPENPAATIPAHGAVIGYWDVGQTGNPWLANATQITKVDFQDPLTNRTTASQMFNGCTALTTILNPDNFDTSAISSTYCMFNGCTALTTVNVADWDMSHCASFEGMFNGCTALTTVSGTANLVTSSAYFIDWMFQDCSSLTTIDTSSWDTSNVVHMGWLFRNCSALTAVDVSNWDTAHVQRMNQVFYGCSSLRVIDISRWTTTSVQDAGWMFWGCSSVRMLDVSRWSFPNLKTTSTYSSVVNSMFCNCSSLTELDLSNWGLSGVTATDYMFWGCTKLEKLDLSGFDMSSVTSSTGMFTNDSSLNWIKINNTCALSDPYGDLISGPWYDITTEDPYTLSEIFTGSGSRAGTYVTTRIATAGVDAYALWYSDTKTLVFQKGNEPNTAYGTVTNIWPIVPADDFYWLNARGGSWQRYGINNDCTRVIIADRLVGLTSTENYFSGFEKLTEAGITGFSNIDFSTVTNFNSMFSGSAITSVGFLSTSNILDNRTSLYGLFRGMKKLTDISVVTNWDVSNITDLSYLFSGCTTLTDLTPLTDWDVSHVTNMAYTFAGTDYSTTYNLMRISDYSPISNWDVSSVTNMSHLFYGHLSGSGSPIPYLANWNVSHVTNMAYMFSTGTHSDTSALANWDVSNVTDMSGLFFYSSVNLEGLANWNTSSLTNLYETFYNLHGGTNFEALANWDVSHVTNMTRCFRTIYLTSLDPIANWDTGRVTNMSEMFYGTPITDIQPITLWNVSSVTNMASMFSNINKVASYDLSHWNMEAVTNATNIFANNRALTTVILPESFPQTGTPGITGPWYYVEGETTVENIATYLASYTPDQAGTYTAAAAIAGVNAWALLYEDGTLIFQAGNAEDTDTHGAVVASWQVPANVNGVNYWNNNSWNSRVQHVIVKDPLLGLTNMYGFFHGMANCTLFENLELIDTSNVARMLYLFAGCNSISAVPEGVSSWNTANVNNLEYAFHASGISDFSAISTWNTDKVTTVSHMFSNTPNMTEITGINNWSLPVMTNMSYMFQNSGVSDLTGLANISMPAVTNITYAFANCDNLTQLNGLNTWHFDNLSNYRYLFYDCDKLVDISALGEWTFPVANTALAHMFESCNLLSDLTGIDTWNTTNISDLGAMFASCASLTNLDAFATWDTSNVTTLAEMFKYCDSLSDISGLAGWNVENVRATNSMFLTTSTSTIHSSLAKCNHITSLTPLMNWRLTNCTNMDSMFRGCGYLADITGLTYWNPTTLTDMDHMFDSCFSLTDARPLGNWTTVLTRTPSYVFNYDTSLVYASFENWDMSGMGTSATYCFNDCRNLVEITFPERFAASTNNYNYWSLSGNWIFGKTEELVNIQTVLRTFTADQAGTYYKRYRCTLYPMGGTVNPNYVSCNLLTGNKGAALPTPERAGYEFLGWFDSLGNRYETIPADTYVNRLYARWSAGAYTLILEPNRPGLEAIEVQLNMGEEYTLSPDIFGDVPGYYLYNWSTRASGQGTVYRSNQTVLDLALDGETTTLYAQWMNDEYITVHFHWINYVTGEELGNVDSEIYCGEHYASFDPAPTFNNPAWASVCMSYADDLDAAHFDNTGLMYDTPSTYYYSNNDYYTHEDMSYLNFEYNTLTAERAQLVDTTRVWTISDDGTDVYLYYMPPYQYRYHFNNTLFSEILPEDIVMNYNGVDYQDGEFIVEVKNPNVYFTNYGGTLYTPNYITRPYSGWYSVSNYGLVYNGEALPNNFVYDMTFNYDFFRVYNGYSYLFTSPNIYVAPGEGQPENYWNYNYNYDPETGYPMRSVPYPQSGDIFDVWVPLDAWITLDVNGGTYTYGNTGGPNSYDWAYNDGAIYRFNRYLGSGYNPDVTDQGRFANNNIYYSNFVNGDKTLLGWYTAPEGGVCVVSYENNTSGEDLTRINLLETPVLYAHWTDEEAPVIETRTITIHNSAGLATESVREAQLNTTLGDNGITLGKPANYSGTKLFFNGWYSEPDGQGELITADYIVTDDMDIYAYWTEAGNTTLYFDLYSTDVRPTETISWRYPNLNTSYNETAVDTFWNSRTGQIEYQVAAGSTIQATQFPIVECTANTTLRFAGWFTEPNGGERVTTATEVPAEGLTYYAHWVPIENGTVNFDYDYSISFANGTNYATFEFWYENNARYGSYNGTVHVDLNISNIPTDENLPADSVEIWIPAGSPGSQLLPYPDLAPGQSYSYKNRYVNGVNYLVITNPEPIIARATISTNIPVSLLSYTSGNPDLTSVIIRIDTDLDGTPEVEASRALLSKNVHVSSQSFWNPVYLDGTFYPNWNPAWGDEPENANQYFYVGWSFRSYNGSASRYYRMLENSDGTVVAELINNTKHYGDHDYTTASEIIMQYPVTMLPDANVGRITITEQGEIYQVAINGRGEVSTQARTITGTLTYRWQDDPPTNEGNIYWNMGRFSAHSGNSWTYDTYEGQSRTVAQLGELANGTGNVVIPGWWSRFMRRTYSDPITEETDDTLALGIGAGDIFYNSGAPDDYYMWEPESGQYALTENEYYINSCEVRWVNLETQTDIVTQETYTERYNDDIAVEVWVRHRGASEPVMYCSTYGDTHNSVPTTGYNDPNYSAYWWSHRTTITFTDTDIVDVEVRVHSSRNGYVGAEVGISTTILNDLRPHQWAYSDYNQFSSSVYKIDSREGTVNRECERSWASTYTEGNWLVPTGIFDKDCLLIIWEITGQTSNNAYLYNSLTVSSATRNNTSKVQTTTVTETLFNTGSTWVPINVGTFYVLGPNDPNVYGTVESLYSTHTRQATNTANNNNYRMIDPRYYTVETIENWNNTGRTMYVVNFDYRNQTDAYMSSSSDPYANGTRLTMSFRKSEVNIYRVNETNTYAVGALGVNRSMAIPEYTGINFDYENIPRDSYGPSIKTAFESLNLELSDYIDQMAYCSAGMTFTKSTSVQSGSRIWAANSDHIYISEGATVFPTEEYSFYLQDSYDANSVISDHQFDIILDGQGTWVGGDYSVLNVTDENGIDTTVTPVVWYCLTENPDFTAIDAEHGWTQTEPVDEVVYGLHLDYTKADTGASYTIYHELTIFDIHIYQKAPANIEPGTELTINANVSWMDHASDVPVATSSSWTGSIRATLPNLILNLQATPATGTVDDPTEVVFEQDLDYVLTVRNNSDHKVENIRVTENIPAGLAVNLSDIHVDGIVITDSPLVTDVVMTGNTLQFTVKSLRASQTLNVDIPTIVNTHGTPDISGSYALFDNYAYVDQYLEMTLDENSRYNSNHTYHDLSEPFAMPDPTGLNLTAGSEVILTGLCACGLFALYELIERKRKHQKD